MDKVDKLIYDSRLRHFVSLPRNIDTRHHKSSKPKWMPNAFARFSKSEPVDEVGMKITKVCCSVFGCGKVLSFSEKLFGKNCINHQHEKVSQFFNGKL